MNNKKPLIVFVLICATVASFFWGGYHALMPWLFLSGLSIVSVICLWSSSYIDTRSLVTLTIASMVLAAVDEYAHTSSGAFRYFDGMTPSPLAVFGWSLFVLGIVATAKFLHQRIPLGSLDGSASRVILPLIPFFLVIVLAWAQGYLRFFDPLLISVYFCLFAASLYYSRLHQYGWCIWVVISSLIFSAIMEYLGGIEGLWVYQFDEPMALFIVFTWALRVLTILAVSSFFGVEIQE